MIGLAFNSSPILFTNTSRRFRMLIWVLKIAISTVFQPQSSNINMVWSIGISHDRANIESWNCLQKTILLSFVRYNGNGGHSCYFRWEISSRNRQSISRTCIRGGWYFRKGWREMSCSPIKECNSIKLNRLSRRSRCARSSSERTITLLFRLI
jgi:hypothetical protein